MKFNLQNKFLIPTLGLVLAGMVLLSVISILIAQQSIKKATIHELDQLSETAVRQLDEFLNNKMNDIEVWSEDDVFRNVFIEGGAEVTTEANDRITYLLSRYPQYETMHIADATGLMVASNNPEDVGVVDIAGREYFQQAMQGETVISKVMISKVTGNPIFAVATPVRIDRQITGVFLGTIPMGKFSDDFIQPIKVGTRGYAYMINSEGLVIAHPEKSHILSTNLAENDWGREMTQKRNGMVFYPWEGTQKIVSISGSDVTGWIIGVSAELSDVFADVNRIQMVGIITTASIVLVVAVIIFLIVRTIIKRTKLVIDHATKMGEGHFDSQVKIFGNDEITDLAKSLNNMTEKIASVIREVQIASTNVSVGSQQMSQAAQQVSTGSEEMSSTAQKMSQGATEQASAVEQVSSSMEEMAANIKQNADNASVTEKISLKAAKDAEDGGQAVTDTVAAMKKIAEKITIIEDIARETNMLSLNAAIEAARAGEHGKGFAVVAAQVRKLAESSQKAAGEISELSTNSVAVAESAGELLSQIVPDIRKTAELVQDISAASREQNSGADQINKAITDLDTIIQQNAASSEEVAATSEEQSSQSEEMAATSEELASQAEHLSSVVSFFQVGENYSEQQAKELTGPKTPDKVQSKPMLQKNGSGNSNAQQKLEHGSGNGNGSNEGTNKTEKQATGIKLSGMIDENKSSSDEVDKEYIEY
jgi:methyl-accepting chemotaxis protein